MRRRGQTVNAASSTQGSGSFYDSVDHVSSVPAPAHPGGSLLASTTGATAYTSPFQSSGGTGRGMSFGGAGASTNHGGEADGKVRDGRAKTAFKDWKRRGVEKAFQSLGLVTPIHDANTADIGVQLQSFTQMRDGLRQIQAEVRHYVTATEGLFGAAHNMRFLFAPLSGETAKQLKQSLCRVAVQDAMIRGLTEYLEAPLKAVLEFCDNIDTLAKQRGVLLLDYDYHKRKYDSVVARLGAGKADVDEEARVRLLKLNNCIDQLKDCTTQVLAQVAALAKVEPQLKESLFKGLAACQVFYCQASLAPFTAEFIQGEGMQDYIHNLERATQTLEKSLPLPPLGEYVTYLQNALVAAMAEVRGEAGPGEVFGRPLSDFDEPPPVLLECMGFLDAQGLYVPGLFRVAGDTEKIRELKARFDSGEHVEFDEKVHNVHEVATLLKMFFRELPDPVVPATHYHTLLDASSQRAPEFVEIARRCVSEMPKTNATCLRLLFAFLFRVSLCSDDNKMNTENLGIVFAPNLLRVPNSPERSVLDLQRCINVVKRMIESATDIFPDIWQGYPAAYNQG